VVVVGHFGEIKKESSVLSINLWNAAKELKEAA